MFQRPRIVAEALSAGAVAGAATPCPRHPARWLVLVAVVLLGFGARAAPAAGFDPLTVAVPVADQAAGTRRAAEREALEIAVVRLAGNEAVLDTAPVRAALRDAARYYAVSGYQRRPAVEVAADAQQRPWSLRLEFDQASLLEVLAAADAPAWLGRRPELLVWLAFETVDGERRLLSADDPVADALRERARRRGLPVTLPLLDLEELQAVSPRDVWARFEGPLERASLRYPVDTAVTVRLYPDALGRWLVDWEGEIAGERVDGAREVTDPMSGARAVVDAIADRLVARFAVGTGAGGDGRDHLWLQVDEIASLEAYAAVLRYLETVAGVEDVSLVQFVERSMLLRLDVAGASARLLDVLRVEARLPPRGEADSSGGVPVWRARWRG